MKAHYRPIRSLAPETARKIAAGEVIDRPGAVVRELLDNAIDAGATRINLSVSGGGADEIRVTDNGCGMTKEDLEICWQPHTTSKIQKADDLLTLETLGFRGEALSSVAAVSQLEITTTRDGHEAWRLQTRLSAQAGITGGQKITCEITPSRLATGTTVSVKQLFANFPARKQFLKRDASETAVCKQAFLDKALAWPQCAFSFITDTIEKYTFSENRTFKERCLEALRPDEPASFFYQIEGSGSGFTFSAVLGSPAVVRRDRRFVMVFINGRRVSEYSLMQALEYGAEGSFPNGAHPFACLFLTIDPSLIDFNIHPAKKEVRFKDQSAVHRAVSTAVRTFYRQSRIAAGATVEELTEIPLAPQRSFDFVDSIVEKLVPKNDHLMQNSTVTPRTAVTPVYSKHESKESDTDIHDAVAQLLDRRDEFAEAATFRAEEATDIPATQYRATENDVSKVRYIGQIFNVFLAAEFNGSFYLIDQHAAHERILYNQLMESRGTPQEQLIPYLIETDTQEQDTLLQEMSAELRQAGFCITQEGSLLWNVTAVPMRWTGTGDQLKTDILHAAACGTNRMNELMASAACRQAIKEGDILDSTTATAIAKAAFALPEPYCPHGRPIWSVFSKADLYNLVKRT